MHTTRPDQLSQPDREKISGFLKQHPVGVLATVDSGNNPHASAVYFSIDDNLNVSFTTKRDTEKHANISYNDAVMLAVYDAGSQSTVQIQGKATEVADETAAQRIYLGTLQAAEQTGQDAVPPVAKIAAGPYVAYTIAPDNIWMTEYGWGNNFAHALDKATDPPSYSDPA